MNVYDRIDIVVAGNNLTGRPIEFILDEEGSPLEATVFETTCPACGQSLTFCLSDARQKDGVMYVACPQCGAGTDTLPEVPQDTLVVTIAGQETEEPRPAVIRSSCPFLDPIETGAFIV